MEVTRRTRRGFTVTELVLVMGIMVVLVVAANGAIALCMRAVDAAADTDRNRERAAALDQLRLDLSEATGIVSYDARDLTITVADRTGDGNAETVRYRWNGSSGDPLLRTENGDEAPLVSRVASFELTPIAVATRSSPTLTTTNEMLLSASQESPVLGTMSLTGGALGSAILVTPALPSGAVSWEVSRVRIKVKRGISPLGVFTLSVRTVVGGEPSATDIASATVQVSAITQTSSWQDFSFAGASMGAEKSVAIVGSALNALLVSMDTVATIGDGSKLLSLTLGGWTEVNARVLIFELYGKASMITPGAERTAVPTMIAKLQLVGGDAAVETPIALPTEPTLP
jgi:prepilin-type N-terminal cleavage/methylation domain-containing protein